MLSVKILICTFVFIAFDVVTGLVKAFATTGFDSSIMRAGFFHKLGEVLALLLTVAIDYYMPIVGVAMPVQFASVFAAYLIIMETGSIIENIGAVNPDLVGPLSKIFSKLKGAANYGESTTTDDLRS